MSITVQSLAESDADADRWNRWVDRSPHGTVFHRYEALDVQAEHGDVDSHLLIGYKGEEPVGILPIFERRIGPISVAFSPPPDLLVSYLGPALLNMEALRRRKQDRRLQGFVEGVFEWLREEIDPVYTHVRTNGAYEDLRPFLWNGCQATPEYTYLLDLTPGRDEVFDGTSGTLRSNVRNTPDEDYTIEEGGPEAIAAIIEQVRSRYESQDASYHVTPAFVTDLYDRLSEDRVRPYVCSVDGSFVGGIVALDDGETVYRWQGGVRPEGDLDLEVNDLVDWRIIRDAIERGRTTYDFVGANDPHINRYKAKFNPGLETYYSLERGSALVTQLAHLYGRLR